MAQEMVKSKNVRTLERITLKSGEEIKLKVITLDLRMEINDRLFDVSEKPNFSIWIWLLRNSTKLSDVEINNLSTDEIVDASTKIVEFINKKK